ncbi:Fungal transcriptional regulatory protein, N-terminal [Penicillium digitatum]|uniref:Fungal transcriptional regulatory protein, N-terminal n=1 Tax=Penicillium digitatum TaxID=36651 RepID=A0A7T7BH89_PENDI|nr:Fungal transcriptional regulatory protein, N-terminal [Penicillium digitatum]
MDLHSRNDDRPPKRTRQACEPCRCKKAKCTGERPACSTCARLRQKCYYAAELHGQLSEESHDVLGRKRSSESQDLRTEHELHNRIESLESSLAEVLQNIRSGGQIPGLSELIRHWKTAIWRQELSDVGVAPANHGRTSAIAHDSCTG